ncbi:unnamed protein product [Linum trigynum]|uniref:Pentatricopeptide repeat-containing protein n=1 Tax=Linum trigynum TaxID=586398 RepID=A0AAV2EV72_9ROSI
MRFSSLHMAKFSRSLCSSSSQNHWSPQNLFKQGFTPTLQSINQFLYFLLSSHRFDLIAHFVSQMSGNRVQGNSQTHSISAWALLKLNMFEEAERFIKTHMPKSSTFSKDPIWDCLIVGFSIHGKDPDRAFTLLQDSLMDYGVLPAYSTFRSLIHSLSSQGKITRALEVLELMNDDRVNYPYDNFVCSSVISGFCKIGKPELAIEFFHNSLNVKALKPNLVTYTALVTALCDLGRVNEVSELVCRMREEGLVLDVVFYSNWISGCLREGMLKDALQKHYDMVKEGIMSDAVSYTILIDGLSKQGSVEKTVGFLHKMVYTKLKPGLVTYSAIMLGFCRKGKVVEAFTVFELVKNLGIELDEFVYGILVDGFCRQGNFKLVSELLDEMETTGIRPSIITYNTLINGLCNAGRTSDADELSKGILGDIVTYSTLLQGYVEEDNVVRILDTIQRSKDAGISLDMMMCNILLKAHFMVGAIDEAYALYKGMQRMGLVADSVTYCTMIDGYFKVDRIDEALETFDEFRKSPISSVACYNCLISWLCKKNLVEMAMDAFLELIEKSSTLDAGTYMMLLKAILKEERSDRVLNMIYRIEELGLDIFGRLCDYTISLLCKRNFVLLASEVYIAARRNNSSLTSKSYYFLLRKLIVSGNSRLTRPILSSFVKQYGLVELKVNKILLHFLCQKDIETAVYFLSKVKEKNLKVDFPLSALKALTKNGGVLAAYELIMGPNDNVQGMDVVDYSLVVDGLIKEGHHIKALDICDIAESKQVSLNIITYNSLINGLCHQGCLVEAFRLFDSLERMNLRPSEVTYSTLIDNLCREGYLVDAKQLVDKMVVNGYRISTHVYNSLVNCYCKTGQIGEALKILSNMDTERLKPDEFTVSVVINGYCQSGNMEQALGFFSECQSKGTSPDFLGYLLLIRGLCTKGRMEEARSILREMLKSQSVLQLLSSVDNLSQTELVDGFLASLCDQGSIKEAVMVLDEVSALIFPHRRKYDLGHELEDQAVRQERTNVEVPPCEMMEVGMCLENSGIIKEGSQSNLFDSCSSLIVSLCSKGDLGEANRLAQEMLANFDRN